MGKETKRRQQRSPPSLAHVAIEKPSLETASAFYSSMAIIMDDIDDEDGPDVNSLSTDELRKEVARGESKLRNPNFVDKAPDEVVAKEREKLDDHRSQQARLEEQMEKIKYL